MAWRRMTEQLARVAMWGYVGLVVAWLVIGALPSLAAEIGAMRDALAGLAEGSGPFAGIAGRALAAAATAKHPARVALEYGFATINLGLGLVLITRRSGDRVALLLAVGLIGTAATFNVSSHAIVNADLLGLGLVDTVHEWLHVLSGLAYTYAVVLFPDGRVVPAARSGAGRFAIRATYVGAGIALAAITGNEITTAHPGQAYFVRLFGVIIPVAGVAAQTYRLRRARSAVARQQSWALRWGLVPLLTTGSFFLLFPGHVELGLVVFPFTVVLVPAAVVVGILRYRLWDIDLFVNRALVFSMLAAAVIALDAAVIVGTSRLLGLDEASPPLWIAATSLAILLLEPARSRADALANRLVYGTRLAPADALDALLTSLAHSSRGDALARVAALIASSTSANEASVWVTDERGDHLIAAWPHRDRMTGPAPSGQVITVDVRDGDDRLGHLTIVLPQGSTLSPTERALVNEIAGQGALLLRNERLARQLQQRVVELSQRAAELQELRRRLVATEDAARRRLERDIHDGAQQYLVAVAIQLDLARDAIEHGDADAEACVSELRSLVAETTGTLRDLARGIYPEALSRLGPAGALAAVPVGGGVELVVTDRGLGRQPAEIEAGVFFACLEAVQNASKHAEPSRIHIDLGTLDGHIVFEVHDDGCGFDPTNGHGGGALRSLNDRLRALGGELTISSTPGRGTMVAGAIPVTAGVGR